MRFTGILASFVDQGRGPGSGGFLVRLDWRPLSLNINNYIVHVFKSW